MITGPKILSRQDATAPSLGVSWGTKGGSDSTMIHLRGYDGDGGCSHAEARVRGQSGGRGAPICLPVTVARLRWCWPHVSVCFQTADSQVLSESSHSDAPPAPALCDFEICRERRRLCSPRRSLLGGSTIALLSRMTV